MLFRRRRLRLAAICLAALCAEQVATAADLEAQPLRVELITKGAREAPKGKKLRDDYARDWKRACTRLAGSMLVDKGPWGFGAFTSFSCYQGKKLVAGKASATPWTLSVTDGEKDVTFQLVRKDGDDDAVSVSETKLPPSENTMRFLGDAELADLVAFAVLDSMPFAMHVAREKLGKGTPPTIKGRHWSAGEANNFKFEVPQPPEELTLYRLSWDEDAEVWRSDVVGSAKRQKIVEPKKRKKRKSSSLVGGSVTYATTADVVEELADGALWAHDARGPEARRLELQAMLKQAYMRLEAAAGAGSLAAFLKGSAGNVLASLFETAASGYVGLRYGPQVLSGDELLGKMTLFSLLLEVRGGPVKGLRYYYDKMPKVTANQEGVDGKEFETSIAWSRHVLGFSWDFDPGILVDRITIDPKIGLWSFEAKLPVAKDADGKVLKTETFELGSTASLALEVGLEMLAEWYALRAWYAIDTGYSVLKKGGSVTSNRFGIDAYFTAGPTIPLFGVPFKSALLAFMVFESVTLKAGNVVAPAPGEDKITGVSYNGGYAGGGVAISW